MRGTLISAPTRSSLNAKHRTALWVLIALTLWTSWLGSGDLALESHEIFVARTSEEMLAREDWVVPWYAEEPRLKKPPLNYWIVMAVDQTGLLGTRGIVSEREARVPSMIGAALLVWATVRLGARAMNERAGLLAGALLASSAGLVQHAHNARPELLYAALCALALERFARSGDESGERVARSAPLIGWALLGLACLTKGPQLPLPMVAGWIIGSGS